MERLRRTLAAVAALGMLAAAAPHARAQAWPARPVKIVNGFPAGGPTDILARILAEKLQGALGQAFVVENRPGATGAIGSEFVARSAPDGYTLVVVPSSTHAVNPNLTKLSWDPQRDFTPIAMVGNVTTLLIVNPGLPVKSVQEFVAYAKANPGKLNFGTPGRGSNLHLGIELLKMMAGFDAVHVPYKGTAPAATDLIGGQIQFMFDNIVSAMPNVLAGKVRAIAITTSKRSALFPDLPTIAESGYAGFEVNAWAALLGPAGLPQDVVQKLNAETVKAVNSADVKERYAKLGVEPFAMTPGEAGEFMKSERERWGRVIRDAKISVE
ncbi:MAG: tripartite tricarboxylate transporter substrate binding protein [Betaproteobacteria bacterium]|nr:tripartite tricarboxylate transporter substrate binding protein [Betaproteobacteria bacterium]